MDNYTRGDKADLSGMTPAELSSHLQPKYDGDTDFWDDIKFPLMFLLTFGGTVACIGGLVWMLLF